jgi:LPS-assembly lipoprotein
MRAAVYKNFLFLSLLALCSLLSACGFHFRGQVPLAPPLKKMYLQSEDPYSQLTRNVKQSLKISGVELVDTADKADTILDIIRETNSEQLLSIGGTQQTRQYNITLTVTFQITDAHGKVLVPIESLSETRSLTILSNQILGGSNEENNLFVQMRRAIVYDIMSRLSSSDVSALVTQPPAPIAAPIIKTKVKNKA